MASPKCRLEVWKPKIRIVEADGNLLGLYEPERWVACETHEDVATNQRRGNALESVSISDSVFESMVATMRLTNRPQDFKAYDADVYKHVYKDSDGVVIPNYPSYPGTLTGGEVYLRQRWGVFTNFFYEFQHVRIVDLESHLVLFAGRITKITKRYEDGNGSVVQLDARDALNEIANITTSNLIKSATFLQNSGYRRSDMIKYMLRLATAYEGSQPSDGPGVNVTIDSDDIANIANSPSGILTTVDAGTNDTLNQYSRFERSAQNFRRNIKWNAEMTGTKHVLAEICRWAMLDPHNSNTSEREFGYDLFVDANYGKKNLMATIGPGVTDFNAPHFNYFKRGNRLSAAGGAGQDAAVYGLTVKYPTITTAARVGATAINVGELAESINASVTTFETTNNGIVPGIQIQIGSEYMYVKQVMPDVEGAGAGDELEVIRGFASTTAATHSTNDVISNPRSAQTIMQRGFNFEDSKEDLHTEAVLTFNAASDNLDANSVQETANPVFKQKRFEIMYVTEVAYGTSSSNTLFHWDGRNIDDSLKSSGSLTAEYIDAYNAAGAKQADEVARIQYQSHATLTGSTNFAFILLSDIKATFPSSNYSSDTYVELRGKVSGAKCRLNLAAGLTEAHQGRPSKVWGTHRVLDMGQMSDEDTTDLRAEIASRLAQATTGLRQGAYAFSKAPYYWWDGVVHSIATANAGVSFGQDITVKNVNGSAAVNITNFGVREGMLVHKMTANHAAIAQVGDPPLDIYGYIGDMRDNQTMAVKLEVRNSAGGTHVSTFSVDDPIRIIIPVRAGTEVFVDNVIAEIYGEHIASKIEYNEDPIPETRITSIGKNETRLGGGHRVKGLISSIAQTALAVSEKTKTVQPPSLGSLFGGLIVTLPNGSEAHTALKATWSAGSVSMVDGKVFNFAAGSTATNYGVDGNMVASQHYIVYLDPEGENLGPAGVYHLYTKRVGTYKRDSDNIPIFHIIATSTAGITKPIIRLQPNLWLNHTEVDGAIPLTNEASAVIDTDSIISALLQDDSVLTAKINDLAVERGKIGNDAINASKIEAGTITTQELNFSPNTDSTATIRGVAGATSGTLASIAVSASTFYIGTGHFGLANTPFFVRGADGTDGASHAGTAGDFSLGEKLIWDDSTSTLNIKGTITASTFLTNAASVRSGNTLSAGNGILIDSTGIIGASGTGASNVEFEMRAGADGKAYFGGGICTIGKTGIYFPPGADDATSGGLEWEYGSKSTWLFRGTNSNVIRWLSDANTPALGRMDLANMDLKLIGGDFFDGNTSLAPLYGGSSTDAQSLHTHGNLGGGDTNENSFKYITRSGTGSGSTIAAQNATDSIELVGGTNMELVFGGSTSYPTITFNATGGGGSDPSRLGNGTAGAPSYSFSGDTSAGMYHTGSALGFSYASTIVMYIFSEVELYKNFDMNGWILYDFDEAQARSDGDANDPTYTWINDLDSGMYLYNTDAPAISAGGATKLLINNAGTTTYLYNNLNVVGSLTKSSGTFSIAHPLDEDNKTLVHGFVESPRYDLIYRGSVILSSGTATASIDEASNNMTVGTFEALTKNPQIWVQNDTSWGAVKGKVENGNIIITAEDNTSSDTVSWLVVAERNDTFIRSEKEPWTDETGAFVPEWDTASLNYPVV